MLDTVIYNGLALLPLIVGLVTSSVSDRLTLAWARRGSGFHFREINARRHLVSLAIVGFSVPAKLILLVCAFVVLWWPIAIALILICLIVPSLFVTWATLVPLTDIQPMVDLITVVAAAIVIWILVV